LFRVSGVGGGWWEIGQNDRPVQFAAPFGGYYTELEQSHELDVWYVTVAVMIRGLLLLVRQMAISGWLQVRGVWLSINLNQPLSFLSLVWVSIAFVRLMETKLDGQWLTETGFTLRPIQVLLQRQTQCHKQLLEGRGIIHHNGTKLVGPFLSY